VLSPEGGYRFSTKLFKLGIRIIRLCDRLEVSTLKEHRWNYQHEDLCSALRCQLDAFSKPHWICIGRDKYEPHAGANLCPGTIDGVDKRILTDRF